MGVVLGGAGVAGVESKFHRIGLRLPVRVGFKFHRIGCRLPVG